MSNDKLNCCSCIILDPDFAAHTLPLVQVASHVTLQSTAYKSTLNQTFTNPLPNRALQRVRYNFPLFDGVSVVGFQCRIGDRIISSVVKERKQARVEFDEAADKGQVAGLLEQSTTASDVFATTLSNIPAQTSIHVTVSYIGELKHDAGLDGLRLMIPTAIAPRYGQAGDELTSGGKPHVFSGAFRHASDGVSRGGMEITVDVSLSGSSSLQKVTSPTHPIAVAIGTLSTDPDAASSPSKASASLILQHATLDKDFVLQVAAKDIGVPQAFVENHPDIPGQRAIMATFVPKFVLKPQRPEIIFIADRSGSMEHDIPLLKSAMRVFVKSLPTGVYFNICSFGSRNELLWEKSSEYSAASMQEALKYIDTFKADFGGTETLSAVQHAVQSRRPDLPTELMLLTDGDIWQQEEFFQYLNGEISKSKGAVRLFSLGIGNGVSSSLLEGCARAGRGFSQAVSEGDRLDSKVVRMVKGALSPHINDSRFEVQFEQGSSTHHELKSGQGDRDDFEMVDSSIGQTSSEDAKATASTPTVPPAPISLYNPTADLDTPPATSESDKPGPEDTPDVPDLLFAPSTLPPLFPFSRTTVFVLMSAELSKKTPKQIVFHATSPQGPLELIIPLTQAAPGRTFHQMAARKALLELEEGRGWIQDYKDSAGNLIRDSQPTRFERLIEQEAVRLGTRFQVASRWCSFIAVEASTENELAAKRRRVLDGAEQAGNDAESRIDFELVERSSTPRQSPFAAQQMAFAPPGMMMSRASPGGSLFSSSSSGFACAAMPPPPPSAPAPAGLFANARAFGTSSLASIGGGLFGSSGASPASSSGGLFGSSVASPASSGGSLFGGSGRSNAPPRAVMFSRAAKPSRRESDAEADQDALEIEDSELQLDTGGRHHSEAPLVHRIIVAQAFDGSWPVDAVPWDKLGLDDAAVTALKAESSQQIASTATVVLFLEHKLAEERDVWELVVDKARSWLDERLAGASDDGQAVWSAAKQRLGLA